MKTAHHKSTFILTTLLSLAACGGGGSETAVPSTGTNAPVTSIEEYLKHDYPVEASLRKFFTTPSSYTVQARDQQGNLYTVTQIVTPKSDQTDTRISYEMKQVTRFTLGGTMNGGAPEFDHTDFYFGSSPFVIAGAVSTDGAVFKASTASAPPAQAKIGERGPLASGSFAYPSIIHRQTVTWSLEADESSKSTAWLCINTDGTDGKGPFVEKDCIRIDTAGTVSGFKSDIRQGGRALAFR